MKSMWFLRLVSLFLVLSVAASGPGQIRPGDGGGGDSPPAGGDGTTASAPANWNVAYATSLDGLDYIKSAVLSAMSVPEMIMLSRAWSSPTLIPRFATNVTGLPATIEAESSGTTRITIKWLGQLQAKPNRVLVRVYSSAGFSVSVPGDGTADNGLASDLVVSQDATTKTGTSQGWAIREVAIDQNGEGIVEVKSSAFGSSTAYQAAPNLPMVSAFSGRTPTSTPWTGTVTVEILDYGVVIDPWVKPTYRKEIRQEGSGTTILRVPNENLDPTKIVIDTAFEGGPSGGTCYVQLSRLLWGPWYLPSVVTSWSGAATSLGPSLVDQVTVDALGMAAASDSPLVRQYDVVVSDGTTQRQASARVRIHAPAENATVLNSDKLYSDWHRVTPERIVRSSDPIGSFSIQSTVTSSITRTVSYGGAIEVSPSFAAIDNIVKVKLSGNATSSFGETASLAVAVTSTMPYNPPKVGTIKVWVDRRVFWLRKIGYFDIYKSDGFFGIGTFDETRWFQSTKEDAERLDYQEILRSAPVVVE